MRVRRDEVQHQIQHEEEEKSKLQQEIAVLTKQLAQLNSSLARKVRSVVTAFHAMVLPTTTKLCTGRASHAHDEPPPCDVFDVASMPC